ncbi:hypothetical protein ZWY2020_045341 [Hordeum vulgare]|nr:hypothetical protein ZWY2020_045341 [Hordeum vulgare]
MDASLRTLSPSSFTGEVRSAVSSLLLSPGGASALDTVFSHLPPPVTIPPLGSSVYYHQSELLRTFAATHHQASAAAAASSSSGYAVPFPFPGAAAHDAAAAAAAGRKMYRGVRQRQTAAHAYDRAAYRLRGEYARLNFPGVMDGADDARFPDALRHLRDAVDAKIQAIRVRMARKRARARRLREESKQQQQQNNTQRAEAAPVAPTAPRPVVSESATTSETTTTTTSSYGSPEGVLSAADFECSLQQMPSFDPELIWEMLNF